MNTEARDPILRGLDELAGLTDLVPAPDRMAAITRKARANRRRKVAAGVAGLAIIAAGAVGTAQLLSDGETSTGPGIAKDPTPPPATSGLTIDLTVDPTGPRSLGVIYRIHGTATAWSAPGNNQPMDVSGPAYTSILLDGQEVTGTDGGDIVCRAGAPEIAYDETFGEDSSMAVQVPRPGTHTVTVQAPYCGADGKVVPNEVSTTVAVPGD